MALSTLIYSQYGSIPISVSGPTGRTKQYPDNNLLTYEAEKLAFNIFFETASIITVHLLRSQILSIRRIRKLVICNRASAKFDGFKTLGFLPKSSTRTKSRFLFVIETARAFTLVGEMRWPAPQSETVIVTKARFDPGKCQKEIFVPCPPFFLSAVLLVRRLCGGVAEWRTGGPAHEVVKNEDVIII